MLRKQQTSQEVGRHKYYREVQIASVLPTMISRSAVLLLLSSLLVGTTTAFVPVQRASAPSAWGVTTQQQGQLYIVDGTDGRNVIGASAPLAMAAEGSDAEGIKLIIAGAPASGKGTQCEIIKKNFGVVHLSTGDMLRAAVAAGTDVGKQAKEFMDSGKLVPDEVIIGVVKDRLEEDDCQSNGWLLDGFPRTPGQADALAQAGVSADCFIFLNVPDSILVERVVGRRTDPETGKIYHMTFSPPDDEEILARLEQRSDDTEEKVKVRLEQFHANVEAVKGFYTDISVEVDGTESPDVVSAAISEAIAANASK